MSTRRTRGRGTCRRRDRRASQAPARVIFRAPGVKETNWSATRAVVGVDGVARRWVYLHYFKEGQPSINWLDPSFAGMRLTIGDALHSLADLGPGALRLDANGFLGVEKSALGGPAWSEGHPLSEAANHLIASIGVAPEATRSAEGMPHGRSLYGSLPDQLADGTSFARQLRAILAVRAHHGVATSRQVDIPDVPHRGMLVLVHELSSGSFALTVLNFAGEAVSGTVRSEVLPPGATVVDMFTQQPLGAVDDLHAVVVLLPPAALLTLLSGVRPAASRRLAPPTSCSRRGHDAPSTAPPG